MGIGRQWTDRLRLWAEQFPKHYRRPVETVEVEYFTTMDQLTLEEALKGPFLPAPKGTAWGKKWEYGWFRARIAVPEELAGQRLVLTMETAPEMLLWVNGVERGSIDRQHRELTLTRSARAGEVYEIVAEGYAGHGPRMEGAGPAAWGEDTVPEPPPCQVTVGESMLWVWNEPVFQVAMDYLTLYSLLQRLPEKSLRAMRVLEGLKRFTYIADFELPEPGLTQSLLEADRLLKPLLACRNGSTAPEYTVFGQSHLDMAWLWPVEETMRKTARTYSNQLSLMEEYPEYAFLLCEPPILEYLKELYPNVYRRVREGVSQGRFYPEGGMWIESDTNIPSGESLIRQFVYGKRWFREELGAESVLAWMPDTFGFSGQLPQIMKKCQLPYFATQKLLRQDPEAEPFPYNLFQWEGIDGSRVLGHIFKKNNAVFTPAALIERWEEDRNQAENIGGLMFPYGYGDGGGGPTRKMVEMARRCVDLEGAPRCRMESPVEFFRRAGEEELKNIWCGELYLAWHRGTYTAQAETKAGLRRAETALKTVEYHLARRLLSGGDVETFREPLDRLWKTLLFNQFHDVAAGASIHRVHERASGELAGVCGEAAQLLKRLTGEPEKAAGVYNHTGRDRQYRGLTVPAQGWAAVKDGGEGGGAELRRLENGLWELRNEKLTALINARGELVSLKRTGGEREYLSGPGNRFLMFKDVNTCYDAWEMGSMTQALPVALEEDREIKALGYEDGAALSVTGRLHDSPFTQIILLRHGAQRLEFITTLDWRERHKLLKAAFPVGVYATQAAHEIQFGYVKRPTHRSRQSDRDQYEVCNHRYTAVYDGAHGLAVLNDCKYGVSVEGSEIRLSLMRAPLMPDQTADRGSHTFTYAVYPFEGPFQQSDTVWEGIALNEPLTLGGAPEGAPGPILLPEEKNIIVDTIKPADTVKNAILVRAYEAMGMETVSAFSVHPNVRRIEETDMLEENGRELSREELAALRFGAFEIKTLLLYL